MADITLKQEPLETKTTLIRMEEEKEGHDELRHEQEALIIMKEYYNTVHESQPSSSLSTYSNYTLGFIPIIQIHI
jgi:hypothetical protein